MLSPSLVELFGTAAVTAMVVAYAFEARGASYVLAFAAACAASSAYAIAIASWPFAAAEAVWCLVALRRYANHPAPIPKGETA